MTCLKGGHFGLRRTADHMRHRAYNWPGWRKAVVECCQSCEVCARVHRGYPLRQAPLQPLDVNGPVDSIHTDLCGSFPRMKAKCIYILTSVNALARYLTVAALPNKGAQTMAEASVHAMFCIVELTTQI